MVGFTVYVSGVVCMTVLPVFDHGVCMFLLQKHGTLDKKGFLPTQNICAVEELTDARFDKYSFQVLWLNYSSC